MSVELIRLVETIQREKNVHKHLLLDAIKSALTSAARKHYPDIEPDLIQVEINAETGDIVTTRDGTIVKESDFGRIAAQTAKQVIIQKIREAERDSQFGEFQDRQGELISGTIQRIEGGVVMVNMGKSDGILPKSEQIPGESFDIGKPVRAVITEVKKAGQRVKIVLSRRHPDFVRRLFEREIPEISEGVISIRGLSREAGFRSKVAVSSLDNKIDAVGACVGVRGTRIKNIVDELGGERIDIVRWNESLQVLIPNALQPAEIEEVMLCHLLGRAVVLVRDDQLSLAIGRKGQNVRLATKLVGWDIEIRTAEELDGDIEKAVAAFTKIPGVEVDLAERLVEQGILGYDDLSVMEVDSLVSTIEGLTEELAEHLIQTAEAFSEGTARAGSNETPDGEVELSESTSEEEAESALESNTSSGTVSSDD
ncbi:MAG: transcription termination factor NusA [Planctomycetota bacterium]|nr:MAG: transcription termination factor NusA [Planctomycetota bacterium]